MDTTAPDGVQESDDEAVRYLIVDAATVGGKAGFYFLPPIVPKASYSGTLDAALLPKLEVRVCALPACASSIVVLTRSTSPAITLSGTTGYQVNWQTKANALNPNTNYRLSVYANTMVFA